MCTVLGPSNAAFYTGSTLFPMERLGRPRRGCCLTCGDAHLGVAAPSQPIGGATCCRRCGLSSLTPAHGPEVAHADSRVGGGCPGST
jgi:hypothetical protein